MIERTGMTEIVPDWGSAVSAAAQKLADSGFEQSHRDSRALLAHVLETTSERIFAWPEKSISPEQYSALMKLVDRRLLHEPLSRILGRREFWSLSFALSDDTLDPRADSESVIETVLVNQPEMEKTSRILDLGTGTGCLLAALLSEYKNATGVAVDVSDGAVKTAQQNIIDLGLANRAEILQGNWDDGLEGRFDIIVSNPPYIVDSEISGLDRAVATYDPVRALAGGADGLEAYRQLAVILPRRLADNGLAVLEFGHGQAEDVGNILASKELEVIDFREDLAGRKRCVICRLITNE
ncbi:MAG: peptide chain release factor N(5)-glutamine methyltransferase [Alphaproteobacteria bacterium]|jgi:release factor glutamine methyltransferase|nr:peptide chain release factor N(5)-glutamine methyltransferase [Alphaproteobacteria bacterium]MBT4083301.1 peptide chain release factor N(5)-glutamine methyltransferase [Alphaproteobacteria bacterium]MBT4543047.1 peptide chain release factor N(5)-glutamine methyltransferase [Alphaproteobacteria bacterium]MBT7747557.1 peptide chain release factor N(5)-glutamine methyltransferase [Alphaproteobacteria bacterium]